MTVTDESDKASAAGSGGTDESPSAGVVAGEGSSEMLYGAGQTFWLAVVTVVAFLALILAAVALWVDGGDGGGGGAAGPAVPAGEQAIVAGDFFFDPPDVALFADEEVSVTLDNEGSVEHNWSVLSAGTQIASEDEFDESMVLAAVDTIAGGESATQTFTFEAGDYQVICTIPGHFDEGMEGSLTVAAPEPAA